MPLLGFRLAMRVSFCCPCRLKYCLPLHFCPLRALGFASRRHKVSPHVGVGFFPVRATSFGPYRASTSELGWRPLRRRISCVKSAPFGRCSCEGTDILPLGGHIFFAHSRARIFFLPSCILVLFCKFFICFFLPFLYSFLYVFGLRAYAFGLFWSLFCPVRAYMFLPIYGRMRLFAELGARRSCLDPTQRILTIQ